jgi:predicted Zn-dependent protease
MHRSDMQSSDGGSRGIRGRGASPMPRKERGPRGRWASRLVLLPLALMFACAINPATGERQLALISEAQEIEMGREYDPQIVASMGLYPDEALQDYVQELGSRLAASSERPNLPWTFRVLDDPIVNAFAVPGGFIYLTRGIMSHLTSEAELAGILGHEIGHVTARHSVSQMSRQQLAQIGLGVGTLVVPELQAVGGLMGAGLQVLMLRYSRDAEREADDLGFRYMNNLDYDPRELVDVFRMLEQVGGGREGSAVPGWLQTHPDPRERQIRITALVEESGRDFGNARVARNEYMQRIDGIVFGENPRNGFFENDVFFHPDMRFRMDFPAEWQRVNQRQAVQAMSPQQDAALVLTIAQEGSPQQARNAFVGQEGVTATRTSQESVNGLPAASADFTAATQDGRLQGVALFLAHEGTVFTLLGYAPEGAWSARQQAVRSALGSFRPLTDQRILAVQPRRIEGVNPSQSLSFQQFVSQYPSTIPSELVALINQVSPGEQIPAGTMMKRVTGGENP